MATKSKPTQPVANNRTEANRKRRLLRTIKQQPNNLQAQEALKNPRGHTRKKPQTPYWSHTMIQEAKLFKEFTNNMDKNIFSSNESVRANTRLHLTRKDWSQVLVPKGRPDFSIAARANYGARN